MKKRGQMKISFGMIFSIILIVAFLAFAFYGIRAFLNLQDQAKVANFVEDFQNDIDNVWKSSGASDEFSYSLPGKVDRVCIRDEENGNLILIPRNAYPDLSLGTINHLNLDELPEDPYCIDKVDGKVTINLEKEIGENLVRVS